MSDASCKLLKLPDELLQHILWYIYEENWHLTLGDSHVREDKKAKELILRATSNINVMPLLVCRQLHEAVREVFRRTFIGVLNVHDLPDLDTIPSRCMSMAPLIKRLCLPDKLPDKSVLWPKFLQLLAEMSSLKTIEIFQVDSFLLVDIMDEPFNYESSVGDDDVDRVYDFIMGSDSNEYFSSRAAPYIHADRMDVLVMEELARRQVEVISHQVFCYLIFRSRLPPRLCSKDLDIAFLIGETSKIQVVGKHWIRNLDCRSRLLCDLTWNFDESPYTGTAPNSMRFVGLNGQEER